MKNLLNLLFVSIFLFSANVSFAENNVLDQNSQIQLNESNYSKINSESNNIEKRLENFKDLSKITIVIPAYYNDGTRINKKIFEDIESHFLNTAGGFNIQKSFGKWLNKDNKVISDRNYTFTLLVEKCKVEALLKYVSGLKETLKQDAIYFEVADVKVKFI